MKRWRELLLICFLWGITVGGANASINVNGSTGLVLIPNAHSLDFKDLNLGGTAGHLPSSGKTTFNYFAQLGAFKGLEAGFIGGSNSQGNFKEGVFINLKYSLDNGEAVNPLHIAIGAENLTSSRETDLYMVFSKVFKEQYEVTAGFLADFPGDRFRPMGVLGVDIPIIKELHLLTDGLAGESFAQLNAGVTFAFNPNISILLHGINLFEHAQGKGEKSIRYGFSWKNPF